MILDEKKNPFYWHDNKERDITFNLPPGKYYTKTPLEQLPTFKPYGKSEAPKFGNRDFLSLLRLFKHRNKNKASISLKKHIIIVDPKYYNHKYKPLKVFTLRHEIYHKFFHAKNAKERKNRYIHEHIERQCDRAARDWMLANGYNPIQVRLANALLLKGEGRKEHMRLCTTDARNNFRR